MREELEKLIAKYEAEIEHMQNTNYYEDTDMYSGMQIQLEEVVSDLKDLLKKFL